MTIYYRDIIEREDLIINEETFLYLVQCDDTNKFSLKAIKKIYLEKMPFDPYTRAIQYWPIDLESLFTIENNEEALSKIFYYEHDSQRLVLSNGSLTRIEINNLLKIDPVLELSNISEGEEKNSVIKLHPMNFNSGESNGEEENGEEEFISFIKISIILEGKELFDRVNQLKQSAQLVHALCDSAKSCERLPFIFTLNLIKKECESIRGKIDELSIALCVFNGLYPDPMNEGYTNFLVSIRNLCSIICNTIDKVSIQYLNTIDNHAPVVLNSNLTIGSSISSQTVDTNHKQATEHDLNTDQQNNEEEVQLSGKYDNCINTIANRCITFFKSVTLTMPLNEVSYPYNRTRVHL